MKLLAFSNVVLREYRRASFTMHIQTDSNRFLILRVGIVMGNIPDL